MVNDPETVPAEDGRLACTKETVKVTLGVVVPDWDTESQGTLGLPTLTLLRAAPELPMVTAGRTGTVPPTV